MIGQFVEKFGWSWLAYSHCNQCSLNFVTSWCMDKSAYPRTLSLHIPPSLHVYIFISIVLGAWCPIFSLQVSLYHATDHREKAESTHSNGWVFLVTTTIQSLSLSEACSPPSSGGMAINNRHLLHRCYQKFSGFHSKLHQVEKQNSSKNRQYLRCICTYKDISGHRMKTR